MIEEKKEEKVEALETVKLVDRVPIKTTKIGTNLSNQKKRRLVQFLKSNLNILP